MRQRIVNWTARPEFWLGLLLTWIWLSALRSWQTPFAAAAGTEALRWTVGIGLTMALGAGLRGIGRMTQAMTAGLLALTVTAVLAGRPDGFVTGPYGDHQLCASALLALLPFSLALALAAPRADWRWAGRIASAAGSVCLVLTQTRAAWAGAAVGAVVFAAFWLRDAPAPSRRRHTLTALAALASVLAVFLLLVQGSGMGGPLAARAATWNALGHDGSWQWRLLAWRGTLHMIARHPLAGWGIGHYPSAHGLFTRQTWLLGPAQRPSLSDQAHDLYLQTAADMGLVGLGLYLAALAAIVRLILQTRSGASVPSLQRRALRIAAVALTAGQGVDALASPSWQFAEVSLLFWLGLGIGLAASRADSDAGDAVRLSAPLRRKLQFSAAGAAAVLLTAQALPLGLLSPAEAYFNAPAGGTFQSAFITPASIAAPAFGTATYNLKINATYLVAGSDITEVVSSPDGFAFTNFPAFGFLYNATNGSVTIQASAKGKSFTAIGKFTDNTGQHQAITVVTIT